MARRFLLATLLFLTADAFAQAPYPVDWAMVARIREEGLQRSGLPDRLSYMTDVLGARLTNSRDMQRAQAWALAELRSMGLANVAAEPFMDYGVTWDNEFTSLHLLEPDYQPMVGYPIAWTPGTGGKRTLEVVYAEVRTRQDAERLRGTLRGKAVLSTAPPAIDRMMYQRGPAARTEADLRTLAENVIPPSVTPDPVEALRNPRTPANADVLNAVERLEFYRSEGVAVVLESSSGWPGVVRGFGRPGAAQDGWSREGILASLPIVAVTPEHYNRMVRIALRNIPIKVEVEVRNRVGDRVEPVSNILAEIPGSDRADEIVMLGAHFDTWHASPNASDNTSGAAVMMEAMRILKALGVTPRRTIRIALWNGEEQGLWGSRAYVRTHFGNPYDPAVGAKPGYEKLSVYFNQDYGPGLYRGVWLQRNEHVRKLFEAWMEPFHDFGMTTLSTQGVGSTDHVPFDDAGLPGFQFIQDAAPGTGGHTNMDFYDTLPIDDLKKNAVVVASFVYHAAMHGERLPRRTPGR